MNLGIVIQARMGSSRFPGKSLEDLGGVPMIQRLIDRMECLWDVAEVIVATSDQPSDDVLAEYCASLGVPCFRGSESDVLGRYAAAAETLRLEAVVRACGDSPLTDPEGIRAVIRRFERGDVCFVHTRHPAGWPVGTAVDLITTEALLDAAKRADHPEEREHVVPYLLKHPHDYPSAAVELEVELRRPSFNLSVDHPGDLERLRRIYRCFDALGSPFGPSNLVELIDLLDAHPELAERKD